MSAPALAPGPAATPRATVGFEALMERVREIAGQCDRCGSCLPVCPLFAKTGRETATARGKVSLIRGLLEGGVTPTRDLFARLDFCLQCRACTNACPSKVRTGELVSLTKGYLAPATGRPGLSRAIDGFLAQPGLVRLAGPLVRSYARSAIRPVIEKSVLKPLLPSVARMEGLLPGRRPARSDGANHRGGGAGGPGDGGQPPKRGRLKYFAGCMVRLTYPEVMKATIKTLRDAGYEVTVVDESCCGLPHWSHGDLDRARKMAAANLDRLAGPELVVTDCASCGSALVDYREWLAGDPEHEAAAKELAGRVKDVSVVLAALEPSPQADAQQTNAAQAAPDHPVKVTYHDPCHLCRGQGVRAEPRQVLRDAGYDFIEMKGADICCGGSGTFSVEHYADSMAVLEEKTKNILATGADAVVTSCPSCLMQLEHGLKRYGGDRKVRVIHLTEAVHEARRAGARPARAGTGVAKPAQ